MAISIILFLGKFRAKERQNLTLAPLTRLLSMESSPIMEVHSHMDPRVWLAVNIAILVLERREDRYVVSRATTLLTTCSIIRDI